MYRCKCGREFEKKQSYVAHCGHCSINLGYEPKDRFGDRRAWSRGKTKDTDRSIKSMSEKLKGREGPFKGHHHSEDFKSRQLKIAKYNAENHLNGWKSGNNKVQNKYEKFAEDFLVSKGINYIREFVIPQSFFGKRGSYYQLDFLVNGTVDLEIDGSSHSKEHDFERDLYVGKKYRVYRIRHNDSIEELQAELDKFVFALNE